MTHHCFLKTSPKQRHPCLPFQQLEFRGYAGSVQVGWKGYLEVPGHLQGTRNSTYKPSIRPHVLGYGHISTYTISTHGPPSSSKRFVFGNCDRLLTPPAFTGGKISGSLCDCCPLFEQTRLHAFRIRNQGAR